MIITYKRLALGFAILLVTGMNAVSSPDDDQQFIEAASKVDLNEVGRLLKKGANVNAKDKNSFAHMKPYSGVTALHYASLTGHVEVVKVLLASGADVDLRSYNGFTAPMYASERGQSGIATLLISKGADVNAKARTGFTALMAASSRGRIETVKTLIAEGADIDARDKDGLTALRWASEEASYQRKQLSWLSLRPKFEEKKLVEKQHRRLVEVIELLKGHGAK